MNQKRLRMVMAFAAIVIGYFMALLDTTIVNIALPELTRQFGGSVSYISWVMNGYNLAFAALILTAARLADQFGRKRLFIIGVALFTVASLIAGFSTSLGMLIAARTIQGLAAAIIVPVTIPLTTTTFPKEKHGLIIGIWGAIAGLAAASGPLLGGLITEKLNWHWIFYVNVPLGLISILLTGWFIKESRDNTASKTIDYGGMLCMIGGMFLVTYALITVVDYGWNSRIIAMELSAGLVCLLFFFYLQKKGKEPMLPLMLLKIKAFNGSALSLLIVGAGLSNLALLSSFFLTGIMGMTLLKAGMMLSMLAVGSILSSAVSGTLSQIYGSRWFAVLGFICIGVGTYSMSGMNAHSEIGQVLLRLGIAGVGVGFTMAPVMSAAIRHVPEDKAGISSGVINMAKAIGSVLGTAILVTLLQQNLHTEVQEANVQFIKLIQQDEVLLPAVKEVVVEAVMKRAGLSQSIAAARAGSGSGLGEGNLMASLRTEIAVLMNEPQSAEPLSGQVKEAALLVSQANLARQEASVKAFSLCFKLASLMLLPGLVFGLYSDQGRVRRSKGMRNLTSKG